jgi:signal transduction histidine kinase/CheY-like chemotaxis protein
MNDMKKRQNHDINLFVVLLAASLLISLLVTILTARSASSSTDVLIEEVRGRMEASAVAASKLVSYERLTEIKTKEDAFSEEGEALRAEMTEFADEVNLLFVYYIKLLPGGGEEFVIDNDPNPETVTYPGVSREPVDATIEAAKGLVTSITPEEVSRLDLDARSDYFQLSDETDKVSFLSAYAPIYAPDGSVAYLAGVDGLRQNLHVVEESVNTLTVVQVMSLAASGVFWVVCMVLFRRRAKQSEEASRAKSSFLSSMSHELRTPLNAIIGMTAIGEAATETERKDYAFTKIEDASHHLMGVINDILDMSKIEAKKLELAPVDFLLEKTLMRVSDVMNFRIEEKDLDFKVHIDQSIPKRVHGDDQRLAQVLTNLLSNAVKFTPEGGSIHMEARLEGEEAGEYILYFSVKDNGIGLSDEQKSRLFQAFEQAEISTSRRYGGTGLGLAISKRIIEMMGGRIWVESEEGQGAKFSFTVRMGHSLVSYPDGKTMDWSSIRVLAVDDEKSVRDYFLEIARANTFGCDVAVGGDDALSKLAAGNNYDVCFVDWRMPGMDGITLSRKIKEQSRGECIVIMISSSDWREMEADARAVGVERYIAKPLFPSSIIDALNAYFGERCCVDAENADVTDAVCYDGVSIMLAEDMEINREIVLALLEPTGLHIDCAANGEEAVAMFKAAPGKYSLIFMDVRMPVMDGLEAATQIRSLDCAGAKTIPIIAMTANVFKEDIDKCLEAGMNGHIGKPLDFDAVLDILRRYLDYMHTPL